MLSPINTLIFDLGNVIINLEDEQHWWNNIFLPIFIPKPVQQLKDQGLLRDFESGKITENDFLHQLQQYLQPGFETKDIINAWNALLLDIPSSRVDMLYHLKKTHRLYLLSNTNSIHIRYISEQLVSIYGVNPLEEVFDVLFYSFTLLSVKPEKEIYQTAIRKSALIPEESLFLDDKIENLETAKTLGIQTLHVPPGTEFQAVLSEMRGIL